MLNSVLPFTINDLCDIQGLNMILEDLGIKEDAPSTSKLLDYSKLEPNSIRIFNRIIYYLKEQNIDNLDDFIGKENIDIIKIISKTKEHSIETVTAANLRQVLRDKNITNHGEDLDENFIEFLEVDPSHSDTIMVKKFKKAIEQIKKSKYYSYFGTSKRIRRSSSARSISKEKKPIVQSKTNSLLNIHQIFDDQGNSLSRMKSNFDFKNKIKSAVNNWIAKTVSSIGRGKSSVQEVIYSIKNSVIKIRSKISEYCAEINT